MAGTYNPASHTAPETAKVGTASIAGLAPGPTFTALNDQWVPSYVWLPTALTSDGFPDTMRPFPTATGAVT